MTQIRIIAEYLKARLDITSERGATAVEYGLLVGLIALGLIIAITGLRDSISGTFNNVADSMP